MSLWGGYIPKADAINLIKQTQGRIFGVEFFKKDGSIRRMSCRLGVRKGVKGIEKNRAERDKTHNILTVYDFNANRIRNDEKGAFRTVNLEGIKKLTVNNCEYWIE